MRLPNWTVRVLRRAGFVRLDDIRVRAVHELDGTVFDSTADRLLEPNCDCGADWCTSSVALRVEGKPEWEVFFSLRRLPGGAL